MSVFDELRQNYLRASFLQAKDEGKLPQWFLKQFLFWLLRVMFSLLVIIPVKFLVVVPVGLIWKHTGRVDGHECGGLAHVLRFVLGSLLYFCFLGAIIGAIFGMH